MDIFNMLGGMGQAQQTVSAQLGTDSNQTANALEAAVPLLLSAVTQNASQPGGLDALTSALDKHDGSALDQFSQGQAPDMQDGQKILGHLFGGNQTAAANAVSKRSGIDPQMAMQILTMAAPLVLGYLGRQHKTGTQAQQGGGMDIGGMLGGLLGGGAAASVLGSVLGGGNNAGGLGGMLGGLLGGGQQQQSQAGGLGGIAGSLNSVLDRDGDGNGLEELIGMFGGKRA